MIEMAGKHVLFLHKCFIQGGGVERVHQNLATALMSQGLQAYFYVHDAQGASAEGYAQLNQKFTTFAPAPNSGNLAKLRALLNFIKIHNISVIIAATETANMLALVCRLCRPSLSVIFTRHCAFDVSDQKLPPWAIKCLYSAYVMVGKVVAVSASLQASIKHALVWQKRQVYFVPNAVVSEQIFNLASLNSDNRTVHRYFCAVGRLVEQKGFDLLLHAYSKAKKQDPCIPHLVIVGSGEDRLELQTLAEKLGIGAWVEFTGFTANPYFIIKHAQAFILSSRHEGMPTVLVEAMALNTPVIAFDCPTGPAELIQHQQNGLLIENQNIDALASAMLHYQSLAGKPISDTVDVFKYNHVAQAYMALF